MTPPATSPEIVPRGAACPECGGYAHVEPGGIRCVVGGHVLLFRRILPKTTTGHDRPNRLRQAALDRAFVSPGRGASIPLDLLIRLEGDEPDGEE